MSCAFGRNQHYPPRFARSAVKSNIPLGLKNEGYYFIFCLKERYRHPLSVSHTMMVIGKLMSTNPYDHDIKAIEKKR